MTLVFPLVLSHADVTFEPHLMQDKTGEKKSSWVAERKRRSADRAGQCQLCQGQRWQYHLHRRAPTRLGTARSGCGAAPFDDRLSRKGGPGGRDRFWSEAWILNGPCVATVKLCNRIQNGTCKVTVKLCNRNTTGRLLSSGPTSSVPSVTRN